VNRTGANDIPSAKGRFKIYNKTRLDKYARGLHEGGPFFWEPVDWDRVEPYQKGCRTALEAVNEANYQEEVQDGEHPPAV